jgi:hypothetical protein
MWAMLGTISAEGALQLVEGLVPLWTLGDETYSPPSGPSLVLIVGPTGSLDKRALSWPFPTTGNGSSASLTERRG